jgi:putative membrane protein
MQTLVVGIDRTGDVPGHTDVSLPLAGAETVSELIVDLGMADPEDTTVNALLEALSVARDIEREGDSATVAVVSGNADGVVSADQAIAEQVDELIATYDPDSAIVVIDSTEDERLLPIIESRIRVDSVDRVVVRQARDLESTYYLLKQFLADEELRGTVLVPIGIVMLVFPAILMLSDVAVAVGSITAVIGTFLLYRGFGIDERLATLSTQVRDALYSGRISIVTSVIAAGLALVGIFVGVLGTSELGLNSLQFVTGMAFAYYSVPWIALGAIAATIGRLVDELLRDDRLRTASLNLPFGALAMGLVVRGFSAYFLERADLIGGITVAPTRVGAITIRGVTLAPEHRLGVFVLLAIVVSLLGIWLASRLSTEPIEVEEPA